MAAATASTRRLASTLTSQASQQSRIPAPAPIPSLPSPKMRNQRPYPQFTSSYFNPADDDAMNLYRPVFSMDPVSPIRLPNGEPRVALKKTVKLHAGLERQPDHGKRTPITSPPYPNRLSMPSPLVFDGPAQPRQKRIYDSYHQLRNAVYSPSPVRPVSPSAGRPHLDLPPSSKPLIASISTPSAHREMHARVFDGPAKVSRYQHHPQTGEKGRQTSSASLSLAFLSVPWSDAFGQKLTTLAVLATGGSAVAVAGYLHQAM